MDTIAEPQINVVEDVNGKTVLNLEKLRPILLQNLDAKIQEGEESLEYVRDIISGLNLQSTRKILNKTDRVSIQKKYNIKDSRLNSDRVLILRELNRSFIFTQYGETNLNMGIEYFINTMLEKASNWKADRLPKEN